MGRSLVGVEDPCTDFFDLPITPRQDTVAAERETLEKVTTGAPYRNLSAETKRNMRLSPNLVDPIFPNPYEKQLLEIKKVA